jgi:hypothetical protein
MNFHYPDRKEDYKFPFIYPEIMQHYESFQVFVATFIKILVLCIVTPCILVRKLSSGSMRKVM